MVIFDILLNLTTTTDTKLTGDERTRVESAFARAARVPHFFVRVRLLDDRPPTRTVEVSIFSVSRNASIATQILAELRETFTSPAEAARFLSTQAQVSLEGGIQDVEGPVLEPRLFQEPPPMSKDGLSPMGVVFIVLAVIISLGIMYGFANELIFKGTVRRVLVDPTEVQRFSESL